MGYRSVVDNVIQQMVGNYINEELPIYRVVFWFDN